MGCCAKTPHCVKIWSAINLLGAALLIGVATYLYTNFGTLGDNIKCTVNGLVDLSTVGGTASSQAEIIPAEIADQLNKYIDFVAVFAILPAALAAILVIFAALCGLRNAGSCEHARPRCTHIARGPAPDPPTS